MGERKAGKNEGYAGNNTVYRGDGFVEIKVTLAIKRLDYPNVEIVMTYKTLVPIG